jgi:hypothetical protein
MYSQDSPAAGIQTLLNFLKKNKSKRHLFRGQNRFRRVNAPSGMRAALTGNQHKKWNELGQDGWKRSTHRTRAKDTLRVGLLTYFGRGLGNIISQQYGVSSDAYDVTSDPAIAAFFATHRYPTYERFVPSGDEDDIGVIYRFSVKNSQKDYAAIERNINSLYHVVPQGKIAFTEVIMLRAAALYGVLKMRPQQYIDEQIPGDKSSVELKREATYIGPDTIRRAFFQQFDGREQVGDAAAYFDLSRVNRQRGGIFYPSTRHTAITHRVVHPGETLEKGVYKAYPPTALSLGATHVYELNAHPQVEPFFFRHNRGEQIKVDDLNLLWPSVDDDYLLQLLCGVADEECKQYLADYKTDTLNDELGVIDRGFRPGT